jgi:hypothetical protein
LQFLKEINLFIFYICLIINKESIVFVRFDYIFDHSYDFFAKIILDGNFNQVCFESCQLNKRIIIIKVRAIANAPFFNYLYKLLIQDNDFICKLFICILCTTKSIKSNEKY